MTQLSEKYCLAILITNLKHRKRYPDPITVADCAKYLADSYGSFQQVAETVGVHPSVIRKWVGLATAPKKLREYVKEGKIFPVAAFAILSAFPEESKRIEVVEEVAGWGEPEIIRLIHCMKNNPNLSASECRELVIAGALRQMAIDNGIETNRKEDLHH